MFVLLFQDDINIGKSIIYRTINIQRNISYLARFAIYKPHRDQHRILHICEQQKRRSTCRSACTSTTLLFAAYRDSMIHHQDNMSVCFIPPYSPLLYSKTGVNRGIHYFLIFALKHILWVLVRTASMRRL